MATNNQNQNNQETDKDLLLAIYGGKSFVKIYQALEIGKIKFSFVNKDNPKDSINCYINADDFASDLIDIIDSGELLKRAYNAKVEQQKNNSQYAKDIWESRAGVSQANENQIRKFSIQPGTSQEFAFRASQNKKNIIVGFAYRELKLLAYRWHFLEKDWNAIMAQKYTVKNMTSEYHQRQNMEQYQRQVEEESNTSATTSSTQEEAKELPMQAPETPTYAVSSSSVSNNTNTSQNGATQAGNTSTQLTNISLKVKTPLCDMSNGGKAFQGWGADNKEYNVIIRKELIEQANAELKKLMESASTMGNKLTIRGVVSSNNRIYVA